MLTLGLKQLKRQQKGRDTGNKVCLYSRPKGQYGKLRHGSPENSGTHNNAFLYQPVCNLANSA